MKYTLMLYSAPSQAPQFTPEEQHIGRQLWFTLLAEMKAAGVYLFNYGLVPVTEAKTVRVRDGKTETSDGPFAETFEQLGGYFMLECKDLDEAISWAAKIPYAKYGSIEVRPVIAYTPDMENVEPAGKTVRSRNQ